MELQLALKGLEFTRKKKKWVILLAAFGLTSYGFYRVYHLPVIAQKRKRVSKLLGAFISMAEAVSDCSETIGIVSKDLKSFLQSGSDQIPNSLKQVSKLTMRNEFSQSIARVTQAMTVGILRGYQLEARSGDGPNVNSSSLDQVVDKLFTKAGAGFASVVVGSFARNLVLAFCSGDQSDGDLKSNPSSLEKNPVPSWVKVACSDKSRELIGDCIQVFVSSMVSAYLEETKHVDTYDEFFAGLTNPKHETEVRNVLVTVCNGVIETLVKTSHQVLTSPNSSKSSPSLAIEYRRDDPSTEDKLYEQDESFTEPKARNSFDEVENDGWVSKVSSTLAEPSNRKYVLDVTGRITFETVRSVLELLLDTVYQCMKKCAEFAHETVIESGLEVVGYVTAKFSVVATICLLCACIFLAVSGSCFQPNFLPQVMHVIL